MGRRKSNAPRWVVVQVPRAREACVCEWCGGPVTQHTSCIRVYPTEGHFSMHCSCYRAWRSAQAHDSGKPCETVNCKCWMPRHMPAGTFALGGPKFPDRLTASKYPNDELTKIGAPLTLLDADGGKFAIVPSTLRAIEKYRDRDGASLEDADPKILEYKHMVHRAVQAIKGVEYAPERQNKARATGVLLLSQLLFDHIPRVWREAGMEDKPAQDIFTVVYGELVAQYAEWFDDPFSDEGIRYIENAICSLRARLKSEAQLSEARVARRTVLEALAAYQRGVQEQRARVGAPPPPPIPYGCTSRLSPAYLQMPADVIIRDEGPDQARLVGKIEDEPLYRATRVILRKPTHHGIGTVFLLDAPGNVQEIDGTFVLFAKGQVCTLEVLREWGNQMIDLGDHVVFEPPER